MHNVYVLYSHEQQKFYIGYTADLKRRMKEHRGGNVHSTSRFGSLDLIFHEGFCCKSDALRREQYFKTTKGKKSLRLIVRDSLKGKHCPVV